MTRIFLVRHGEAEGNLYRRAQGQFDVPLTARGREQIRYLGERFRDEKIRAAYASDLTRAWETAAAAVKYQGLTVKKDPRLREMGLGRWENKPWGELNRTDGENIRLFSMDPARWDVPGGEDFTALQDRMEQALLDIAAEHPGETVLCASHGMAIRALLARVLGVPSEEISRIPHANNTAVALLTAENGRLRAEYYNDCSHLPEELSPFLRQNWWKNKSARDDTALWYAPFDTVGGRELYLDCYRDAWRIAHGDLTGFDPELCWRMAVARSLEDRESLTAAFRGDRFAGVLALDVRRGRSSGKGWITFCYMTPENRGIHGGIQLIGCAVAHYRDLGRRSLALTVAPGNPARGFYEKAGFRVTGTEPGAVEPILVMEMPI